MSAERIPMSAEAPTLVGLCPSDHLSDFYMPLDWGEDRGCPYCDCEMVVYALIRGDEAIVERMAEALSSADDFRPWATSPATRAEHYRKLARAALTAAQGGEPHA